MSPFTPEQQAALNAAFNVVCRTFQTHQDRLGALEALLMTGGIIHQDWFDLASEMKRDYRELDRLMQPDESTIRRDVARILGGEIRPEDLAPEVPWKPAVSEPESGANLGGG